MPFTRKWYTADLHFGHASILKSQSETRPFACAEDMDVAILDRINERVDRTDILYILGDFTLSRLGPYVEHLFHSICCRKILVLGNHDVDNQGKTKVVIAQLPWEIPPTWALETKDGPAGSRVWLSHFAHRVWPAGHYGSYHFYGHSHSALSPLGRSRDVGVDCPDTGFGPMTFAELTADMQ